MRARLRPYQERGSEKWPKRVTRCTRKIVALANAVRAPAPQQFPKALQAVGPEGVPVEQLTPRLPDRWLLSQTRDAPASQPQTG